MLGGARHQARTGVAGDAGGNCNDSVSSVANIPNLCYGMPGAGTGSTRIQISTLPVFQGKHPVSIPPTSHMEVLILFFANFHPRRFPPLWEVCYNRVEGYPDRESEPRKLASERRASDAGSKG